MTNNLSEREVKLLDQLAALHDRGTTWVDTRPSWYEAAGLSPEEWRPALSILEGLGCVKVEQHSDGAYLTIQPAAAMMLRRIKEEEREAAKPKDLVNELRTAARSHRVHAWIVICFLILTAIGAFLHYWTGFLKNIGVIK